MRPRPRARMCGRVVPERRRQRLLVHDPEYRGEDGVGKWPGGRRQGAGRGLVRNALQAAVRQRGPFVLDQIGDDQVGDAVGAADRERQRHRVWPGAEPRGGQGHRAPAIPALPHCRREHQDGHDQPDEHRPGCRARYGHPMSPPSRAALVTRK